MIQITPRQFPLFQNKEIFIFFFSIPGLCRLCEIQEREYLKYDIPNLVKVSGEVTDEEYLMEMFEIHALPATIVFDKEENKKIVKYGVLYEKQINDLLKEFKNGKN